MPMYICVNVYVYICVHLYTVSVYADIHIDIFSNFIDPHSSHLNGSSIHVSTYIYIYIYIYVYWELG